MGSGKTRIPAKAASAVDRNKKPSNIITQICKKNITIIIINYGVKFWVTKLQHKFTQHNLQELYNLKVYPTKFSQKLDTIKKNLGNVCFVGIALYE